MVVDAEVHAAQDFYQVGILRADAEILLEEVGVDDGTGNAHAGVAQREVRLAAHGGHGLCGTGKAQNFLSHVGGNRIIVQVLYVVAVDAEGGQSLLGVGGQHGSQIDGTRPLSSVEAPHGFRVVRIHVHCLRTVAPAGGHGDGGTDTLALEFLGAGCTFGHAADGGVGDDTLYGRPVAIAQVALNQVLHCLCQVHGLLFETLTDAALTTVDRRTNANLWINFCHIVLVLLVIPVVWELGICCKINSFFRKTGGIFCEKVYICT